MGIAIDDLEVWQPPKIEQLRPRRLSMLAPHTKQWDPVIHLGVLPEPPTSLTAAPRLQAPQQSGLAARCNPEFPCDHTGAVLGRVFIGAGLPQINVPAKTINGLSTHATESRTPRMGVLSIWRRWRSKCDRQTTFAIATELPRPALRRVTVGRQGTG